MKARTDKVVEREIHETRYRGGQVRMKKFMRFNQLGTKSVTYASGGIYNVD